MEKGDGIQVAQQIARIYAGSPWTVDEGGGQSVIDHSRRMLGLDVMGISFAGAAPDPTPGEEWSENMRAAMYVRAAMLLKRGLIDVPDDELLREELFAHYLIQKSRTVETHDPKRGWIKERKPSFLLCDKDDEVKPRIGRSPDRADAFVLSLVEQKTEPLVKRVRMAW